METPAVSSECAKLTAPAAERNKQPILDQLLQCFPSSVAPAKILEVASGTGQHVAHFANAMPWAMFQPSDLDDDTFASIAAWSGDLPNVASPVILDASKEVSWSAFSEGSYTGIFVANMCHISPFRSTVGLFAGASRVLSEGGRLCIYGPFTVEGGNHISEGNQAFDDSLRARDTSWGYRDVNSDLEPLASESGFVLLKVEPMPANNFMLIYARRAVGGGNATSTQARRLKLP